MNNLGFSLLLTLLLCSALAHADAFQSAADAYRAGNYKAYAASTIRLSVCGWNGLPLRENVPRFSSSAEIAR